MVCLLLLDELHAVSGVDFSHGQFDVERKNDVQLARISFLGENGVPDEEPTAGGEHAAEFLEDLGMVGRIDIHEGEKNRRGGKRCVQKLEVASVHNDLEQRLAGRLLKLELAQVDGDDLLSLELADDTFAASADVQDQALGREIGNDDFELGVYEPLFWFGTVLGRKKFLAGSSDSQNDDRDGQLLGDGVFIIHDDSLTRETSFFHGPVDSRADR